MRAGWHVLTIIHRHTSGISSVPSSSALWTKRSTDRWWCDSLARRALKKMGEEIQLRNKVTTELTRCAWLQTSRKKLYYESSRLRKTINFVWLLLDGCEREERELNRTAKQHQQQPNSEYVIANKWNFISSVQISYWNDDICDGNTDEISSTSVSLSDTEISQKENAFSAQLMSSYMS